MPAEYYQNMKKGKVISKDVLLYKDGANIGQVTIVGYGFPHNKCCVNEHVFILRTKIIFKIGFIFLSQDFIRQGCSKSQLKLCPTWHFNQINYPKDLIDRLIAPDEKLLVV